MRQFFISFFFFSSRRRHTRFKCDWSSDVCSSDLRWSRRSGNFSSRGNNRLERVGRLFEGQRSEERRVGKGVDLGGRRIIKKKKKKNSLCSDGENRTMKNR